MRPVVHHSVIISAIRFAVFINSIAIELFNGSQEQSGQLRQLGQVPDMSGKVRTTWISDDIGSCPEKKVWNSVCGKYRTGLHLVSWPVDEFVFDETTCLDVVWSVNRSRPKLNCGPGRDFEVGPEFGAARKQPIIPGNSRARSCAGEEDRVTWLDLRPG